MEILKRSGRVSVELVEMGLHGPSYRFTVDVHADRMQVSGDSRSTIGATRAVMEPADLLVQILLTLTSFTKNVSAL